MGTSNSTDTLTKQGHLTLAFPLKSPADCAALRSLLPELVPELYKAADAMGTIHYCRVVAVGEETVYLLADFDGEFETVLEDLPRYLGPVLDPMLAHVKGAPRTPVADNVMAFVDWADDHTIKPFVDYAAYPGATARDIRSAAEMAGIDLDPAGAQQLPLLEIMPMRHGSAVLKGALKVLKKHLAEGGDDIGTVHFAHLVTLPGNQLGFFTLYDGPFDKYAQDFAERLGSAFDLMFKFTIDPPPTPTAQNAGVFSKWVDDHDQAPLAFYSAYPGLQVQDVKALLAGV